MKQDRPLSAWDFQKIRAALLVAIEALAKDGNQEAIDLIEAVLEGRNRK